MTAWGGMKALGLEPRTYGLKDCPSTDATPCGEGCSEEERVALVRRLSSDPGLARLVTAWPHLPEHIKAAVLALVETSGR